jgi:hypothetical protein
MRHIRVLRDFGGKETNEQRILPGDYAFDDEAILGLGDFLLSEGIAVELKSTEDEPAKSKGGRPRKDGF